MRLRRRGNKRKMEDTIAELEEQILSGQNCELDHEFVQINKNVTISTISANTDSPLLPVVCLHGFAGACAMWLHNIENIATKRPFYAIDLPGFGRSSRCEFADSLEGVEDEFVEYIEQWCQKMGLEKFILMGHSFGGYIASIFALSHPQRIGHLLLVDPWGYVCRPEEEWLRQRLGRVGYFMFVKVAPNVSPFTIGRWLGHRYGPWLFSKVRHDLMEKFSHANADKEIIARYLHHVNAQTPPSGEMAFNNLANGFFWAKNPLLLRMCSLPRDIPMTFVYGELSWNMSPIAYMVKQLRSCSYVHVQVLSDAGHHLYADQYHEFNQVVTAVCTNADADVIST